MTSGEQAPQSYEVLERTADVGLLVKWLSEILYRKDAEGRAFRQFDVQRCDVTGVSGKGWGERRDSASRTRSVAVKAVTDHQLSVEQTPGGWRATVYFDI